MRSVTVGLVIGTRPEAIKMAPLAQALSAEGLRPWIMLTGQHPGLNAGEHGLDRYEITKLGCSGQSDPLAYADWVSETLQRCWHPCGPRLVLVQGDTSSALGGARAAGAKQVPLGHVEAGLRTHDPERPWPEERFRVEIDARADLLFAPTQGNADNLGREGLKGRIHVTGNTGIDALKRGGVRRPLRLWGRLNRPRLLVTCHRRENWGDGIDRLGQALTTLAGSGRTTVDFVLHPNPRVSEQAFACLGEKQGIRLLPPLSSNAMKTAMQRADLLLSDSRGMQEEAAALGRPLLILRDKTERPESIDSGNALLVGTDPDLIVQWVEKIVGNADIRARMSRPAYPFGQGNAAPQIAAACRTFLAANAQDDGLPA